MFLCLSLAASASFASLLPWHLLPIWGVSQKEIIEDNVVTEFFTCLVILFACEVAAGIWGFVNKDQIAKDVKQFYDQAFQQALMAESETNNGKAVVKTFHETLDCCGPGAGAAVITALWKEELCPKKDSFMQSVPQLTSSCHQKIDELFSGKLYLIGIAAIVVAVIMIFEMILSMVLCCGIRNSSVY
uniref:CD81 molecule n=1 Tax=Apteryx owenii TaxID=8824 RepID=A0A8B9NYE3_APTOW